MEELLRLSFLYDIYGKLLTKTQKEVFVYYYGEDLSMNEIAKNIGISKQAVSENLKRAQENLEQFEKNLGYLEKNQYLSLYLEDMARGIEDLKNLNPTPEQEEILDQLKNKTGEIYKRM
ncbi:MAG: sigma factor-like helix-turn-helix DNA-binding protein [Tissierellia bacterium]|nr:sigma factor-like helix-turn-helix DNA-binding protein [Tissierellia bacterium]